MGLYTPAVTNTQLHSGHTLQLLITESNQSSSTPPTVDSEDEQFMTLSEAAHVLCITDQEFTTTLIYQQ